MSGSAPARLLALVALVSLTGCEALDAMITQQKVKTYRESDFWPDRLSMRPPPPGTIAREDVKPIELTTGRSADGKVLTPPPIPVTRALLEQGRTRYDIHCAVCHGHLGDGVSLVARNMALRQPPSLLARAGQTDGWYFQVISEGFGVMPSYASALTYEERWAIVAYVRALQLSQTMPAARLAPEDRAKLAAPAAGAGGEGR
jgi:mono/diheme cytochrome c family protein